MKFTFHTSPRKIQKLALLRAGTQIKFLRTRTCAEP